MKYKKNNTRTKITFFLFLIFLIIGAVVTFIQTNSSQDIRSKAADISTTVYNVRTYGAKGDGVSDDSRAIQAAITMAGRTGGIVHIPSGTYMLGTSAGGVEVFPNGQPIQSALIIDKNNIIVQGDPGKTILKLMPRKKMRVISVKGSNITIKNLIVDGNKSNRNGSVPWPNGDVVDALVYAASNTTKITVRESEIKNGIEDAIGFWMSTDGLIEKNYLHDNGTPQAGASGISISANTNTKVLNNISERNSIGTWSSFGSKNIQIENNVFHQNKQEGIIIGGYTTDHGLGANSGFTIVQNYVSENGANAFAAISIASASDGVIRGNQILNNHFDGIQISDNGSLASSNWVIDKNICANSTSDNKQDIGIRILGLSKNIMLTGNVCINNGTHLAHQFVIDKPDAVNANWITVNTRQYDLNNPYKAPAVIYELTQSAGYSLFTANIAERDSAMSSYGYRLIGASFKTYLYPFPGMSAVTRLSKPNGSRLYTLSPDELNYAKSIGYSVDGTAFYAYPQQTSNAIPVYRLSNAIGNFYYTQSINDKQQAESSGYKTDGIAFYVPSSY